jgi:hypothetical protein
LTVETCKSLQINGKEISLQWWAMNYYKPILY